MPDSATMAVQLARRLSGTIRDRRVLDAVAGVPRHRFVPAPQRSRAYENVALPIACGQTISQPLVVARMLELLAVRPEDRVLDVGTGSGYHAALLSRLATHVWTIERFPQLAEAAQATVASLGIDNVTFVVGDGSAGLPESGPYDAINVAASAGDGVPERLEAQLAVGGRLVAPVGRRRQHLVLVRRSADDLVRETLDPVRFVPLI
jgi:protein-L-isoaspartate(D-aspartate) O-methyltransferase